MVRKAALLFFWRTLAVLCVALGLIGIVSPRAAVGAVSPGRRLGRRQGLAGARGMAHQPEVAPFEVDISGLSLTRVLRVTVVRSADRSVIADGAELPTAAGERTIGDLAFAAPDWGRGGWRGQTSGPQSRHKPTRPSVMYQTPSWPT